LEGFSELDKLVHHDFLTSLPPVYKNNNGVTDEGNTIDTDLYLVHIIPHAATITLHNPYIDFNDEKKISTQRCLHAAQSILTHYYSLSATSLDITRLHPFVTICWYLAAVVQVQLCKHQIDTNEAERESETWGAISVLRFAMMTYGQRSPIGVRQEKLLKGLMGEIVRMTTHKRSLDVSIPLYPFSRDTLFRKDEHRSRDGEQSTPVPAPLPVSPPFDDSGVSPPDSSHGRPRSRGWGMQDIRMSNEREMQDDVRYN